MSVEARVYITAKTSKRIGIYNNWNSAHMAGLIAANENDKCVIKITEAGKGSVWRFFENRQEVKKFYIGTLNDSFKQALRVTREFLSK